MSKPVIVWETTPDDRVKMENAIFDDLALSFTDFPGEDQNWSDLVEHNVFLSDSYTGPSISLFGGGDENTLYAEWHEETEWATIRPTAI